MALPGGKEEATMESALSGRRTEETRVESTRASDVGSSPTNKFWLSSSREVSSPTSSSSESVSSSVKFTYGEKMIRNYRSFRAAFSCIICSKVEKSNSMNSLKVSVI